MSLAEVPDEADWPAVVVAAPVSPSFGLLAAVALEVELPVVVPVADWLFTLSLAGAVLLVALVSPVGLVV